MSPLFSAQQHTDYLWIAPPLCWGMWAPSTSPPLPCLVRIPCKQVNSINGSEHPLPEQGKRRKKDGEVQNANSDEDRWRRAQVSTPSPLHPLSPRLLTPHMHARKFPPYVRTHGSTWNTMPACPPWMRPDHYGDGEPQQQRVNDPDDGLTPVAAG